MKITKIVIQNPKILSCDVSVIKCYALCSFYYILSKGKAKAKLFAETLCEKSVDLRDCIALSYKEMENYLYFINYLRLDRKFLSPISDLVTDGPGQGEILLKFVRPNQQ